MELFAAVVASLWLAAGPAPLVQAERPGGAVRSAHLSLPAAELVEGSAVRLGWFDTPGSATDWVTVVARGQPDTSYGAWTYTAGAAEGSFPLSALEPGEYEARLYLDWPRGDFEVVDRLAFRVVPARGADLGPGVVWSGRIGVARSAFEAGQGVEIFWRKTEGMATDWVTVVAAGSPDDRYGPWAYTGRRTQGRFEVGALPAGAYEARLYLDWPRGGFKVAERLRFTVR